MYKYTDEQLASMKKVEASREKRLQNLFARMSADEKQTVLKDLLAQAKEYTDTAPSGRDRKN